MFFYIVSVFFVSLQIENEVMKVPKTEFNR
jgi:hypothetical protein